MGWNCVLRVLQLEKSVCSYRARLVLYALACHAPDETQECFPSVAALEEETGLSRRGVFRALAELEEAGLLVRWSGRGQCSVNTYTLAMHDPGGEAEKPVHNSAEGCQADTLKRGEECQVDTHKSAKLTLIECQAGTQKRKRKPNLLKVSKLVCMPSKSAKLAPYVHNSDGEGANLPPSAGNYGACRGEGANLPPPAGNYGACRGEGAAATDPDYSKLIRTVGWKPKTRVDREGVAKMAYKLGASLEQAREFCRYNSIRRWSGVNETSCVDDLARAWIARWRDELGPSEWSAEQRRRRAKAAEMRGQ